MLDPFVWLTPFLLLGIIALLGLVGCDQVLGLNPVNLALTVNPPTPPWGSPAGGTNVTITGGPFATDAVVAFGGAAAASEFVSVNGNQITVSQTPLHSPGAVDVVVTNGNGDSGTASNGFTYGVAESGNAVNFATGSSTLQLPPVEGDFVVVAALWSGAGTLSFTVNPPTAFNLIAQTDLPAATPVHIAIYFANNLSGPVAIRGDLAGGSGPSFSLVATGYKFANANQAFTPDQFNSMQGTGASLVLPLAISDLVPGDLIYAVAVSRNTAGALSGGFSAPADPNVQVRTSAPVPQYLLVQDKVVLPADTGSSPFNVAATATSPTASWLIFGMRVRVAT